MQTYRPIIHQRRLQRYVLWALALLAWVAAMLSGARHPKARHMRQRGDIDLVRLVRSLLVARALNMLRMRLRHRVHTARHGRNLRPRHFIRSFFGANLRRALRHKENLQRVAKLIHVLRNLDAYAAQLLKRFKLMRRVWTIAPPIAPCAALHGAPASPPAFSDSS